MLLRSMLMFATVFGIALPAQAGTAFGTKEDSVKLADAMIEIIDSQGVQAAAKAMYDPDYPFVHSRMGVNLFAGSTVIADNREPETVAADYSETPDLTGEASWPRIAAAAVEGGDAILKWYHYDTQEVYDYHCFSKRAHRDEGLVMVCR